ncbi:dihydroneopterin aldolase [Pedobacter cryoconitis]|uniref:Dihydroneopterin aldolase n=1 Tax=Pedobacter cryoconitis TaxID=188932 RepID=A0A327S550_9SPHI|nr:dihydroneopterin aldolase [Pedobacter cryoconitis]RAJ23124.1 dihydroneopterin aldolase [Pedobacter cryoconitis]
MYLQTVALNDVKCFALHGYYPEEQLTGTEFLVSVEVTFIPSGDTEDLQRTVNYEVLNTIILEEMRNTKKMLESVVKLILDRTISSFPFILTAVAGIKKMHPPMPGEIDHSFVQLSYTSDKKH